MFLYSMVQVLRHMEEMYFVSLELQKGEKCYSIHFIDILFNHCHDIKRNHSLTSNFSFFHVWQPEADIDAFV